MGSATRSAARRRAYMSMDATATNVERAAPRRSPSSSELLRVRSCVNLAACLWGALGFAGSIVLTLAGTRLLGPRAGGAQLLGPGPVHWWFETKLVSGTAGTEVVFYAGVAALVIAWLGLGFELRRREAVGMRTLVLIAALWCLPLALGPPLFSRDVYSYIAQGTLLHLGHNPYQVTPLTLGHLGQGHILNAVSHTWLKTTAPYGPLFLLIVGWLVATAGYKLVLAAILVRLLAIVGVALLIAALPPLARRLGADPRRAVWLIALSPLVLFQLVSPGHNDILMAGVMAVGIAAALRWPLLGVAICALAATIKVPAAAGAAFVAVAWAWHTEGNWNRARVLAQSAVVFAAVLAAVSVATGVGASWISGGLFSTPGKVHLAITPATSLGYTTAVLLREVGVGIGGHTLAAIFARVAFGLVGVYALWLLYRVRRPTLVRCLGVLLVVAAVFGPAAWPWYLCWGLVLLAACPQGPLWPAIPAVLVAGAVVVEPNGILALSIGAAPFVLMVYVAITLVAVAYVRRQRRTPPFGSPPAVDAEALLAR
jgi:alpha-1,6-mannosyltransferase